MSLGDARGRYLDGVLGNLGVEPFLLVNQVSVQVEFGSSV